MIGLILATQREAQPLIDALDAKPVIGAPVELYHFPNTPSRPEGVIVVSGMGKARAAEATEYIIDRRGVTDVVSVGICGALSERFRPGALLRITAAIDGDHIEDADAVSCEGAKWASLPSARLATVDEPVFEAGRRTKLADCADVVDMEGLAVAAVCRRLGAGVSMLKGVSDLADHSGKADIQANIDSVSAALATAVVEGLTAPAPTSSGLAKVLRFAKVEHSVFSLPLLFAGAWLGAGRRWPSLAVLALIAVAGVGARTLGMAMNRILDRRLDALNPRTAARELPGGRMSLAPAWGVAAAGLAVYLAACAALGPVCLALSPAPAAGLIVYSLLKRFTSLCHFGIGLCMALAPLGAFVAASGGIRFGPEALLLAAFAFCWISGFDIVYAILDIDSDGRTGVRSIPAALGARGAEIVSAVVHVPALAALVWLWWSLGAGAMAGVALAVAAGGLAMGHWTRIPVGKRFFPVSAIAGVAGALVPLLGGLR